MEMPKVSVIIPVWNCELYIEKCLNSLLNQTLKDIEIICVDDGSTDSSSEIIRRYCEADERVLLLTQSNKKQGAARNKGLEVAKGEYIGFVDADDWVDSNYYEELYNAAKQYNSDIALADYIRIGNGITKKRLNIKKQEWRQDIEGKLRLCKQAKHPSPTNKIYRRDMLKRENLLFPEGVACEDKIFVCKAIYYANSVVSVPGVYYYYFRRPNSTVKTRNKSNAKDKLIANKAVLAFLRDKNVHFSKNDFWVTKETHKLFGICLYKIKEGLETEKHFLFGFIPLKEVRVNNHPETCCGQSCDMIETEKSS